MDDYLDFMGNIFLSLFGFQQELFDTIGAWGIILSAFFVFTTARLLLGPILGGIVSSGTSDMVHRINRSGRYKE